MQKNRFLLMVLCMLLVTSSSLLASNWLLDLRIHGFISQGYLKSNHNNYLGETEEGTFEFNEFGLNVQSQVSDKLRIGAQLFSRDLGPVGNNNIVLDWGYADYHFSDALGLRIGKMKMPYGLHNQGRDVDLLRPNILLPMSSYSEDMRAIVGSYLGGNFYGTFRAGFLGRFEYDLGFGTLNIDTDSPFVKSLYMSVATSMGFTDMYDKKAHTKMVYGGYFRWNTPLDGLRFGINYGRAIIDYEGYIDIPNIGSTRVTFEHDYISNIIYSAELMLGNLVLTGEYHISDTEYTVNVLGQETMLEIDPYGWYGQISYRFADWLELASYYSEFYRNKDDEEGQSFIDQGLPDFYAWQKDLCFSVRFDLTYNWLFKLELHKMSGAALLHSFENPEGIEEDFTLYAVKTTFNF